MSTGMSTSMSAPRIAIVEDEPELAALVADYARGAGYAPAVFHDGTAALARLGERFYRVDASRSRAHGGAGLGLALCRRLLEAQGGTLAFAHAPSGGLRATLALPLAGIQKESA